MFTHISKSTYIKNAVIIFFILNLFFSCQKETPDSSEIQKEVSITNKAKEEEKKQINFNATINDNEVRIRQEPVLDAVVINKLMKDDKIEVTGRSDLKQIIDNMESYWFKIETEKGETGWCYSFFIDYQGDAEELEIISERIFPYSEIKKNNFYKSVYNDNDNFEAYITGECELVFIQNNITKASGKILDMYDKIQIKKEQYYRGKIIDGVKFFRIDDGEKELYISENNVLFIPFNGGIEGMDKYKNDLFYKTVKNPGDIQSTSLISAKVYSPYKAFELKKYNDKWWISINTFDHTKPDGWIEEKYFSIQHKVSLRNNLLNNFFAFKFSGDTDNPSEVFGKPKALYVKYTENRHSDTIDSIKYYKYDGLLIIIYHAVGNDKYILIKLELDNNNYPLNNHFSIGQNKEEVIGLLGEPSVYGEGYYSYFVDSDGYKSINFSYEGDIITHAGLQSNLD